MHYLAMPWWGHETLPIFDVPTDQHFAGVLDLRGDATSRDGWLLAALEERPTDDATTGAVYLGDDLDDPAAGRLLVATLGIAFDAGPTRPALVAGTLRSTIHDLLVHHHTPDRDRTRWNRLRSSIEARIEDRDGETVLAFGRRVQIWLGGELIVDYPQLLNTTYQEPFTHANQNSLAGLALTWSDPTSTNNLGILSNQLKLIADHDTGSFPVLLSEARAQHDIGGDDNYSQAVAKSANSVMRAIFARYQSAARTAYVGAWGDNHDPTSPSKVTKLYKMVTGTYTSLASGTSVASSDGDVLYVSANGSTITTKNNGTTTHTVTDTAVTTGQRGGLGLIPQSVAGAPFGSSGGTAGAIIFDTFEMGGLGTNVAAGHADSTSVATAPKATVAPNAVAATSAAVATAPVETINAKATAAASTAVATNPVVTQGINIAAGHADSVATATNPKAAIVANPAAAAAVAAATNPAATVTTNAAGAAAVAAATAPGVTVAPGAVAAASTSTSTNPKTTITANAAGAASVAAATGPAATTAPNAAGAAAVGAATNPAATVTVNAAAAASVAVATNPAAHTAVSAAAVGAASTSTATRPAIALVVNAGAAASVATATGPAVQALIAVVVPFTTDELLDLIVTSRRQESIRYEILDLAGHHLAWLGGVVENPGTVTNDPSRNVPRTLDGMVIMPRPRSNNRADRWFAEEIDAYKAQIKVRVWWVLGPTENRDYWLPLGTFKFLDATRRPRSFGTALPVVLGDRISDLVDGLEATVSYPPGTSVRGALIEQLQAGGITDYSVDATNATLANPAIWIMGQDSRASILRSLCAAAGFLNPYADNNEVVICRTAPDLTAIDSAELRYGLGIRIRDNTLEDTDDQLKAPNVYLAVDASPTPSGIIGRYEVPASAPFSFATIGRWRPRTVRVPGITDQATADAAARAAYLQDKNTYRWVSFSAPPDPRHDTYDVIGYNDEFMIELSWRLPLAVGADHIHSARGIYQDA